MIGNFLTRGLVMVFGYAYPAYECYKTVERNKPEIDQLRFWCQYWILVALMTVFERVGDTFVSWLPMYSEAKLAFIIYLWYPRTKGTTFVYDSFFKPYVSKHETEIDRNLLELRTRAGDMAFMYCQKVASYGQTRIFEVLQYVAAQSTPRPRAPQPQTPVSRPRQPPVNAATSRQPPVNAATSRQPTARSQATPPQPQPVDEATPSPTSSTSSSQQEKEVEEELSSSQGASISSCAPVSRGPSFSANAPAARGPTTSANAPAARGQSISANSPAARGPTTSANASPLKKSVSLPTAPVSPERSSQTVTTNAEDAMQIEPVPSKVDKSVQKSIPSPQETVMDEAIRLTRGRLRKTRSATTK